MRLTPVFTPWFKTVVVVTILALLTILLARTAAAYERYNDGCQECHGSFFDGNSPQGTIFPGNSKHAMHVNEMQTNCNLCHLDGDDFNPYLGLSNGTEANPGVGCSGCHGRDYGGETGNSTMGLRVIHARAGAGNCVMCHESDVAPLPESVAPVYYGTPDTACDDPCNRAPDFLENYSLGDTRGQDNDGDGLYDESDEDCQAGFDLEDYVAFAACLQGPGVPQDGCSQFDFDMDGDVDLEDFVEFSLRFTG
jgi:hypothetical protein